MPKTIIQSNNTKYVESHPVDTTIPKRSAYGVVPGELYRSWDQQGPIHVMTEPDGTKKAQDTVAKYRTQMSTIRMPMGDVPGYYNKK